MMPNHTSTRFSHDPEVGAKWVVIGGLAASQSRTSLRVWVTQKGETPGVWVGSGMVGIEGLNVGDMVTAEQTRFLFGSGHHPLAGQRGEALPVTATVAQVQKAIRLGAPFKVYAHDMPEFRIEVAKRFAAYNAQVGAAQDALVPAQVRAAIRTQVGRETFRVTYGRDPVDAREQAGLIARVSRPQTTAVAGYDLTFSPVKSVSTLWALADPAAGGGHRADAPGRGRGRVAFHRDPRLVHADRPQWRPAG